ncbi:ribosome-binding protein 1-like isoform X3 [Portunus trituberculatus]|uniref:ribosome-binding protein 1-like isoform X3 n=1 Tax=Portunus trituberculatus TaxID=210409 RepID=UPI001E1CD66D|nr:ribosome-binding protein 1-like isoform X3 [Portunus trituberculatus]
MVENTMDVLVLGAVVLVLTVVVYLVATLGTKETPFEDVANQRQKFETAHSKTEKQQKKPKVKKPKGKKEEGDQAGSTSAQEVEAECEPTKSPPAPEPSPSPQPSQEQKKERKKKKEQEDAGSEEVQEKVVKAEVKKTESAASRATASATPAPASSAATPSPSAKETKAAAKEAKTNVKSAAKDTNTSGKEPKNASKEAKAAAKESVAPAKETKASKETKAAAKETNAAAKETNVNTKEMKESKAKATKEAVKESKATVVDMPLISEQVSGSDAVDVSPAAEKGSSQEKKKKKEKKNDITSMSESKLLPMVQRAPLSGTEIQTLIDVLLNKQQQNNAGGDWVKKGRVDPITQLRRQLEEVENRLRDKDEAHSALSAKITDLCGELHGERSRSAKLKTQLEDTIANYTRQQEVAAANAKSTQTARLNELRATLEQEYQIKFQQQQQLVEQLQNTTNDQEAAALRASLNEAEMQGKIIKQEHEVLTQRCQQYEEHIRALEEKRVGDDASRNAQLTELQIKLQNSDAARAQALAELSAMESERENMRAQITSSNTKIAQVQQCMQEKLREKSEVDSRLSQMESELCSVRQVVVDQNIQIERLKEEKESLASQSVRPAAEGQENGDVHAEHTPAPDTALLQSLLKEKEQTIEEQVTELTSLKKEITRLKEDLEGQREKNNELREKNHKVLEALTITEEKLMARLKQVDEATGVVEEEKAKVRAVLRRIFPEVVVDDALALPVRKKTYQDQGAFLSEFETKALQVATQTAQPAKPEVVEVIKYVEKEVKVEDPALKIEVEKLSKENAELKTQVANLQEDSASAANDSERVQELQNEISSVNEKVAHYQTVLADTENLLKSLQASVESEEVAWKKRLSDKEEDLHQLVEEKRNLELQLKELEGYLEKEQQSDNTLKIESLQQQLQTVELEKESIQEKLQQAEEQLARTSTQGGGNSEESILELKADNEKLRALVTVGQDASRQQEQLIEQLQKELTAAKAALAASRVSKMGYMVGWVGRNSRNTSTTTINNINPLEQQTSSTNGPVNEEQCQEDDSLQGDTASLVSASSASVTDPNSSLSQSEAPTKKPKKKRKGILGKLMG